MKKLLFITAILALPLLGQTRLTVDDAVARALAEHPDLETRRHIAEASRGLERQAGLRPNPTFSFEQENIRSAPDGLSYWSWTDTFAFVEQTFETGGKRQRRVEAAAADTERAELERGLTRQQIAARVRQAYWTAAGAQRIYELLLETAKSFVMTVQYHEVRVREGAMAEADLLRVRLEMERLELAATAAYLEAERARIRLFRAMGQAEIPDQAEYDPLADPDDAPTAGDPRVALENRPEMKIGRLAVQQASLGLQLAEAQRHPDVAGMAGYKRAGGYNSLVAGVSVGLPLFNRNQGEIAAASSRISAARSELASTAAVVRAEVAVGRKDLEIRREQIVESLRPMMEQAAESSKIAQAAYREGGWDLLRLLDAERLRIETESLYYRALAEYWQSVAELQRAMGVQQ